MTRLLIANRGEIARRILKAGRARGMTVAVVSTPEDRDALVRREADAVLEVGDFLDIAATVAVAQAWGADLVHPGYGFLSERADFAEAVEAVGMGFVGPRAASMRALGGKESAKHLARDAGVPTLEALLSGDLARLPESAWAEELAARGIRAPFLVKASGGGGGRGMRVVEGVEALPSAVRLASAEALAGFGDGTVFIERFLEGPRHIEVQVFGDGEGGGVFLGERECSLQRRHQKVLEEAPSAVVGPQLREALGRAAMALVRATRYRGAGTVEFMLDAEGGFHFLEMNTRLQVEHPVTELVYGVDLVDAQLELALGTWPRSLGDPGTFTLPLPKGVALEARILAEDPRKGFLPTPGRLKLYREPRGEGIRVDSGVCEGGRVNDRFDSMIAKLIVWAPDRDQAFRHLGEALAHFPILGCTTNLPFLQALSRHPAVRSGEVSTTWIAAHLDELNAPLLPPAHLELLNSASVREALSDALSGAGRSRGTGAAAFPVQADPLRIEALADPGALRITFPGGVPELAWVCRRDGLQLELSVRGECLCLDDPTAGRMGSGIGETRGELCAPMAGKVLAVQTAEGDLVEEGQVLFILESMKMQLEVRAPGPARVAQVLVRAGEVLAGPVPLARMEAP